MKLPFDKNEAVLIKTLPQRTSTKTRFLGIPGALFASLAFNKHRLASVFLQTCLEFPDAFAKAFVQLGKPLRTKEQQTNTQDYQQMHGLKQTFKHFPSTTSRRDRFDRISRAGRESILRRE
jgi:hypothetical protein